MRQNKRVTSVAWIFLGLLSSYSATVSAQLQPIPHHREAFHYDSRTNTSEFIDESVVHSDVVTVPDAAWVQIHLSGWNLGKKSLLIITSVLDGSTQLFNSQTLSDYRGNSPYFNGSKVKLELFLDDADEGIRDQLFFVIGEVTFGKAGETAAQKAQCGPTDDRVPIVDRRVARVMVAGGTAWLASNGAILTAGHVTAIPTNTFIEFNVPNSTAAGVVQAANANDQYFIAALTQVNNNLGDDYTVMDVTPNANTGQLPIEAYGVFFRMSRDIPASPTIRITGYGDDVGNLRHRTEQTHTGPFVGESANILEYQVDTYNANSGSPVQQNGTDMTFGIHTNAGCDATGTDGNNGTSFENDGLEAAIQQFPERTNGQNIVYLDRGHTTTLEDGTVFRPFDTWEEASSAVGSGGLIHPVRGTYLVSSPITGSFTISAPAVGALVLGGPN